jgi:CheY-like chemotaxis protein
VRVLVVDDNPATLDLFARLLRAAGMEVLTALTARDAIEAIPTADADVLLLDVRLGEHNGLDVLRALEPDRRPRWAVVMTGFDLEGIEEEARRLGAVFVHKAEIEDPAALVRSDATVSPRRGAPSRARQRPPPRGVPPARVIPVREHASGLRPDGSRVPPVARARCSSQFSGRFSDSGA